MRIKSKREFERLIRRYDGGGADPTPVDPTPADPAPADPVPAPVEPAQPFKTFTSQADYDRAIQQAVKTHEEKLKTKLTPEIRKQLEAEANMTAEQKVQAQLDDLEAQKKALAIDKNKLKATSLFVAKGIAESEYSELLEMAVTDDETVSLERAQKILDTIEKAANEKIKAAMKDVKKPNSAVDKPEADTADVSYAKGLAERRSNAAKASNETIDRYLGRK